MNAEAIGNPKRCLAVGDCACIERAELKTANPINDVLDDDLG
jgi:hypothetical protein